MSEEKTLALSRSAAHELKNQLGIVLGFVDLLLEDTPESDPRHTDLLEIRNAAQACLATVTASLGETTR